MHHSRKRRLRVSQEIYSQNSLEICPMDIESKSANIQSRKKSDLSCVVCSGSAHGYNFDAISCESCKAFFRRNALINSDRLKCRRDNACEITLETRRRCKSCRLRKCFAVGMRKEWILTEEEKVNKKRRIEENRRLRLASLEQVSLTNNSKTEVMGSNKKSDFELQNAVLGKSEACSTKSKVATQNSDFIDNVATAFNEGFELDPVSYGWSYPLAKKITALCQILHTKNTTALRLISFYKRLSEFDSLNETGKVNLIKNNLPFMFFFHGSLGYDPVNDIYHEGIPTHDTLLYGSDILEAHGHDIYNRCTMIMRSLRSIVEIDTRILKLALVIFLFSSGLSTTMNIHDLPTSDYRQVFRTQNLYVEQLWTFLEQKYGTAKTVRIFSTLTSRCLLIQTLYRDIQLDVNEKIDPCQVPPIMWSLIRLS